MIAVQSENAEGVSAYSPRLPRSGYLGNMVHEKSTPTGLWNVARVAVMDQLDGTPRIDPQPFQGWQ